MHRFLYTATIFSLKIPLLEIFLGLVSLGILFVAFMVLSAALVKVDIRDIYPTNKNRKDTKEIKVGFFSDSHGIGCLRSSKWLARHFIEKHCDVVLFGGDCVHHRNVHSSDTRLLTEISALLSEKNIGLIAVHGNHDWQLEKADYEKMGVLLLDDAWKELSGSAKIAVCGIADSERGNRPWGTVPSDFSNFDGFRLLLVHNPDYTYELPDRSNSNEKDLPFDYMLSGHLHGGQVHLPGNLEFRIFREDRIAREEGILAGEFQFRSYKGFISKGVGCGFLPIRLFARPEIHILRFHL